MAVRSGIKFEMGSGKYDGEAQCFHFRATDENGFIPCGISREAFEDLFHTKVEVGRADRQFAEWEQAIFDLAGEKYARGNRQPNGAVVIRTGDRRAN